jgi:beta-glucosidase
MKKPVLFLGLMCCVTTIYSQTSTEFLTVDNGQGPRLGYSPQSGVKILHVDGLKFKDLNKNNTLDSYEDWRLPVDLRAKDLAQRMTVEQIAGLMLYSGHQAVPANEAGFAAGTYSGMTFSQSGANPWDLSDAQKKFLKDDNLRHVLLVGVQSAEVAAKWSNTVQAYVEGIGLGIPANNSSDPRHSGQVAGAALAEFNAGAGGDISVWPDGLGMAATFDPALVRRFGEIAAKEYRALGITTALSPQIDLATEPRWYRAGMTFGEGPSLTVDLARAYVDGFQTSSGKDEIAGGWGYGSVNAMAKHWPGGAPEEGGRDGHWAFGKFAVYPGNNFETHLKPFTQGAFKLDGATGMASAVMPYYTISYNRATDGTNLANGFSKYIITDLLRTQYQYDGVVCTDWMITANEGATPGDFAGKPWGVEDKTVAQRHYIALMAGIDQFGGNNEMGPVIEAYHAGVKAHGQKFMRDRFEQSAVRLLRNIFRVGLFENPYLDPQQSAKVVGNPRFMQEGYTAQLKSVVMLKNKEHILPVTGKKTVYIPAVYTPSIKDWWGNRSKPALQVPIDLELVRKYYHVTDDPSKADFAIVFISGPYTNNDGGGYSKADRASGGNGYLPITLQYGAYTARYARPQSIAAGDPVVDPSVTNRSHQGKTVTASNTMDLVTVLDTREMMGDKPVIAVVNLSRAMVFNEFEGKVDAILARFSVGEQAVLDIISGKFEPSGLLPMQMPANMSTVEKQYEDVPFDMQGHQDTEGHVYDFGYGLNWNGVIQDARTDKYGIKGITTQNVAPADVAPADKTASAQEGGDRNVMLNAASANAGPRNVNIGLPASVGGTTVLENDLPVVYFFWPEMPFKSWRSDAMTNGVKLLDLGATAIHVGDVGFSVGTYNNLGTDDFHGTLSLSSNHFGLLNHSVNVSGPMGKGFKYSLGAFDNYDPGTYKVDRNNIDGFPNDRTRLYKIALTKDYAAEHLTGSFSLFYKYADSRSMTMLQYAPYVYHLDGSVSELPGFKIGNDNYLTGQKFTVKDAKTGNEVERDALSDYASKSHTLDLTGKNTFDNGLHFNYIVRLHAAHTGLYASFMTGVKGDLYTDAQGKMQTDKLSQSGMTLASRTTPIKSLTSLFEAGRKSGNHEWKAGLNQWLYDIDRFVTEGAFFQQTIEANPKHLGNMRYTFEYHDGTENKTALLMTDKWDVSEVVTLNAGARVEYQSLRGDFIDNASKREDIPYLDNQRTAIRKDWINKAFMVSGVYKMTGRFGLLGDASYNEQAGHLENYSAGNDPKLKKSMIPSAGLGVFYNHPFLNLVSKATYIQRDEYRSTVNFTNKEDVNDVKREAVEYAVETLGWTTDVVTTPFTGFNLHLLLTLQAPKYKDYSGDVIFSKGNSEAYDFDGKTVTGVSKMLIEIDPSYQWDKVRLWASARYFSKEYANLTNSLYFKGRWETFAGANFALNRQVEFTASVVNLLGQRGARGTISGADLFTEEDAREMEGKVLSGTYIRPLTVEFGMVCRF